ncbi:NAD(P)H-dependent oxidoreductase [Duganella radicis]|uniref:FMN-dependent NADH-azoreductase n=1 Tax=Duganella radicis TaxID=551988 RepID=A0A6L6PKH7_9BURK|nr:NAD(P)H-dependent oxidoreductase [Duganella radicis]MTV39618.1 FMN-dependent NADH-azoreductase [Duganella radicis]
MNILHIDSCALGDHSSSRQVTSAAMTALTAAYPHATVLYRDLAASPLSHASGPLLQVISQRWDADIPMHAELRAEALQSASLMQEFHEADIIVLGAPMHNFSVPSTLKAWLDRLLELPSADNTRREVRLLLVTAGCGALKVAAADQLMNYHQTQLKAAFAFLGIERVKVITGMDDLPAALDFRHAA